MSITQEHIVAIKEVLRISDRKHPAWDKAKEAIAALGEGDGWRDLASCPSDGSPVWIYRPAMAIEEEQIQADRADGEYWRYRIKEGTKFPVVAWVPRNKPQPPTEG